MKILHTKKAKSAMIKLVLIIICFALGLALCNLCLPQSSANAALETSIIPCVIIDAGHGGFDGGASTNDGRLEKDINLEIARKTQSFLKIFGFETIMTRSSDGALATTKKEDMYERLDIARKNQNAIFVSIHQNHFSQQKYSGAQMFYGRKNEEESRKLASVLRENFKTNINPDNEREIKKADKSLYLYKNAPNVCVLIECGFLSNYDEAHKLCNGEYQSKIAFTIAQSILMYY